MYFSEFASKTNQHQNRHFQLHIRNENADSKRNGGHKFLRRIPAAHRTQLIVRLNKFSSGDAAYLSQAHASCLGAFKLIPL